MLDIDLVEGKPPVEVEFRVSLAQALLQTMSLVVTAPQYEGFDPWVYTTYAALPADLRDEMEIVLALLGKLAVFDDLLPDDPAHRDFSAFIAHLTTLSEGDFQRYVDDALEKAANKYERECGGKLQVSSDDLEGLGERLCMLGIEEEHADQIVRLVRSPAELKARLISVITRFWDQFYREESAGSLPLMERSVEYHRRQNYVADFATIFTAVTGRLLPEHHEAGQDLSKVIFMPSCHIGPYVTFGEVRAPHPAMLVTYNCRPTGTPDSGRSTAVQDLFPPLKAMADETRLQILSMLNGRELYAQEIVERLDISQSAVSRHLQLMVTGGVLVVRGEDGMKYYSVNEGMLATVADRLRSFRGKGTSV